jgi:Family of unknown function (DUF6600)
MKTGKLCLAALLGAMPAIANAQPSVKVGVGVNVGIDSYDTVAPGDPVESVDVFYDQMSPYGVWVDEPDAGRVFIPDVADYVPYTRGHWEYTNLGFVWVSTEPFGWATSHYGRWAFSRYFGRWYWLPDTQWGPAWVEWRETGSDFGWAPLAPEIVVRAGWQPPIDSWHYCSAEHVLDVNLVRYYEPRERVVEIHREARPLQHYATVSNVQVVVGPPAARLREHRVTVHPVKVEARTVGRWTPTEARAQVQRAQEHRATFEVQNQRRIETKPQIHAAQVKVIEAHPHIMVKIAERVKATGRPEAEHAAPGGRVEPGRPAPGQPPAQRNEPGRRPDTERAQPGQPPRDQPVRPGEPQRNEPNRKAEPQRAEPNRKAEPQRNEPDRKAEPQRPEPQRAEPQRAQPQPTERPRPEPQRPEPQRAQPQRPEPQRAQPQRPEPQRAQPQRPEPPRNEPRGNDRKDSDRKDGDRKDDRKEPDKR